MKEVFSFAYLDIWHDLRLHEITFMKEETNMFDYPIQSISDLILYTKSIDVREERRKDSLKYHLWNYVNLLDPSSDDRKYLDGTHQTYLVKSAMKKPLFKELYDHCNGFRLYVDSMKKYI